MTHEIEEAFRTFYDEYFKGRSDLSTHAGDFFTAGYQAALPKWTKIEDIPDEWRDGRGLLLLSYGLVTLGKWDKCSVSQKLKFMGYSINENGSHYWTSNNVTHAMLPPSPPKDNES